jgi:bifunctional DNA-binding transcriptional regulator/antitoxin component of YhaV-PrlF toxin-antitoxin module
MASRGRPTQFQIAAQVGKTWRAVVELGEDKRLPVPVDASRRASWLGRDGTVLAVLGEDARVTLRPYAPSGERIEAKLAELAESGSAEDERLILAIRATRLRLKIYEDGRMIVPADVRMALGLPPAGAAFLSLTVLGDEAVLKQSGPRELSEAAALLETIDFDL